MSSASEGLRLWTPLGLCPQTPVYRLALTRDACEGIPSLIFLTSSPAYTELQSRISTCIDHVAEWMRSNRLQLNAAKLNAAKTEILWSATISRRLRQLPQAPLRVGTDFVTPSAAVRDLGIHLDSDMSMSIEYQEMSMRKTVSTCFAVLRQVRSIRRSVSRPVVQSLVTSLVFSRLDYTVTRHCRYSSTSSSAASVSDESSCSTNLLVVEV